MYLFQWDFLLFLFFLFFLWLFMWLWRNLIYSRVAKFIALFFFTVIFFDVSSPIVLCVFQTKKKWKKFKTYLNQTPLLIYIYEHNYYYLFFNDWIVFSKEDRFMAKLYLKKKRKNVKQLEEKYSADKKYSSNFCF